MLFTGTRNSHLKELFVIPTIVYIPPQRFLLRWLSPALDLPARFVYNICIQPLNKGSSTQQQQPSHPVLSQLIGVSK